MTKRAEITNRVLELKHSYSFKDLLLLLLFVENGDRAVNKSTIKNAA